MRKECVRFYLYTDEKGKRRQTRHRLTEADAKEQFVDPEPVEYGAIWFDVGETEEEKRQLIIARSHSS